MCVSMINKRTRLLRAVNKVTRWLRYGLYRSADGATVGIEVTVHHSEDLFSSGNWITAYLW